MRQTYDLASVQLDLLVVGKKTLHFFEKKDWTLITDYVALSNHLHFEPASQAAEFIMEAFLRCAYDRVELVYSAFKNAATQVVKVVQFLPIVIEPTEAAQPSKVMIDYIYEPSKAALVEALVPRALKVQFYQVLVESSASEHGARMTTMSKATDNAEELLKELRLTYNRSRQTAITSEISEIVAGAEALAG